MALSLSISRARALSLSLKQILRPRYQTLPDPTHALGCGGGRIIYNSCSSSASEEEEDYIVIPPQYHPSSFGTKGLLKVTDPSMVDDDYINDKDAHTPIFSCQGRFLIDEEGNYAPRKTDFRASAIYNNHDTSHVSDFLPHCISTDEDEISESDSEFDDVFIPEDSMPFSDFKEEALYPIMKECAILAIKDYSRQASDKHEFIEIEKVNFIPVAGVILFITIKAAPPQKKSRPFEPEPPQKGPSSFEAKVWYGISFIEVMRVRIKSPGSKWYKGKFCVPL